MTQDLQRAFDSTKMDLLLDRKLAFISSVFFSLKYKWDDTIETAKVSTTTMSISPDFFLSLNPRVRLFVLIHETWHVVFKHVIRFLEHEKLALADGTINPNFLRYNYAADYVINSQCRDDGMELWEHALYEEKYRGWSTEQVYNDLKTLPDDHFNPMYGDLVEDKTEQGEDAPSQKDIEAAVDQIIIKAALQADIQNEPGSVPGSIRLYLDKLLNPKIPWDVLLHRYADEVARNDYSWAKPNRRYMPEHYLPSLQGVRLERMAVAWDISGSVTTKIRTIMATELESIRRKIMPEVTEVVTFDTDIRSVTKLMPHDSISKVPLVGGGGTCFTTLIDHFRKNPPNLLIIFSDMCDSPVEIDPKFPVIWVAIDTPEYYRNKQKFGQYVEYDSKEM